MTYGNIVEWLTAAVSCMYHLFYNQMTGSWKSFSKALFVCATLMSVSERRTCLCSPSRSKLASYVRWGMHGGWLWADRDGVVPDRE